MPSRGSGVLTPKRIAIMGVVVAVVAGGTTYLVQPSIHNNSLPPTPIDPIVLAGDYGTSPKIDAIKAHAAASMQQERIAISQVRSYLLERMA